MDRQQRKAAQTDYRERKPQLGIYALRADGRVWVGASPTLDKIENRLRFTLSQGSHPNAALQAAAGQGYTFEVLEALDPETPALSRDRLLKERLAHWVAQTGGQGI
ncbi:GIY-YIG nuclease family protein [Pararhodobacter zhoushanensis]|uniref:GIY-YIG nuclease family protein n=1 Tax=Pararhodobacter zhoushanensis TaxID=2479545 RepID=UPI000F8CA0CF|nr:GIY-YIG nuclease family protein [Pararhodobacter zhoushanensis]